MLHGRASSPEPAHFSRRRRPSLYGPRGRRRSVITAVSVSGPAQLPELTIGALSSATGVPVDTLRTWERRYGYPVPSARSEGSHRRYSAETIGMIQLMVRALDLGHRASAVVGRGASELQQLIGQGEQRLAPTSRS
jgi:hypothetical protein